MFRAAVLAFALASSVSAFTPVFRGTVSSVRFADASVDIEELTTPPAPSYPTVNGWTADKSKFCWGLPGSVSPMGNFDPLGLTTDMDLTEVKRYREAEVTHGRVAMLAVVGFLVAESFHPLFGGQISGPAIRHLDQVRNVAPAFFEVLALTIGMSELWRATVGWVSPTEVEKYFGGELRQGYYPGDIGFDPLGMKPTNAKEFADMQTKELNNGRLAMLATMGFIVQEQVNEMGILSNLGV